MRKLLDSPQYIKCIAFRTFTAEIVTIIVNYPRCSLLQIQYDAVYIKLWMELCCRQLIQWPQQIYPKWLLSVGIPDTKHAALNTGALELVSAHWLCPRDAFEGSWALSVTVMLIFLAAGQQEFQSILYLPRTSQACFRLPCGSEFHTLDDWLWLRSRFYSQNICYRRSLWLAACVSDVWYQHEMKSYVVLTGQGIWVREMYSVRSSHRFVPLMEQCTFLIVFPLGDTFTQMLKGQFVWK